MHDDPSVGIECLIALFGVREPEGSASSARARFGAVLVLEALLSLRAIAKGLASL